MWLKRVKSFLNDVEKERIRLAVFQVIGDKAEVSVSEINCPEPDCPPIKTVILVFKDNEATTSITIHKPASRVMIADIHGAWPSSTLSIDAAK